MIFPNSKWPVNNAPFGHEGYGPLYSENTAITITKLSIHYHAVCGSLSHTFLILKYINFNYKWHYNLLVYQKFK